MRSKYHDAKISFLVDEEPDKSGCGSGWEICSLKHKKWKMMLEEECYRNYYLNKNLISDSENLLKCFHMWR